MSVILDESHFPLFEDLTDYNDPSDSFYTARDGMLSPHKHWYFIDDIEDAEFVVRQRVLLKTRFGEDAILHFYPDGDPGTEPGTFAWKSLKKGHCIAVLYAQKKNMADSSFGIRQEALDSVYVFNCTLQELIRVSENMAVLSGGNSRCFAEGCTNESSKLLCCSSCHVATYCGLEHQRSDWRVSHKGICPQTETLKKLLALDFNSWSGFYDFHFRLEKRSPFTDNALRMKALDEFMTSHGCAPTSTRAVSDMLRALCNEGQASDRWSKDIKNFVETSLKGLVDVLSDDDSDIIKSTLLPMLEEAISRSCTGKRHAIINTSSDTHRGWQFTLLSCALLHLPVWSVSSARLPQSSISKLRWYLQLETLLPCHKEFYSRLAGWKILRTYESSGGSAFSVEHAETGCRTVFSDNETFIVAISKAELPPYIVRIISPCPTSRADVIRSMLKDPEDVDPHVLTIWLRSPLFCEKFKKVIAYGDLETGEESKNGIYRALVDTQPDPNDGFANIMGDMNDMMTSYSIRRSSSFLNLSDESSDEQEEASSPPRSE